MTATHLIAPSLLAAALVACAPHTKNTSYDTSSNISDTPPAVAQANPPASTPANPVYDTPAAYEESTGTVPAPASPQSPATGATTPPTSNGAAVIHTVVAGDTLSGISAKYKIPAASIKQANRMTNDTVVLGRKMVIPPH